MKTQQAWRILFFSFVITLAALSFSFFSDNEANAQLDPQNQNDAIGIRVIPNPNHYSVSRWYESQGFSGSPQALTVDGYEALRDGRTVYINAAHVLPDNKQIYTNIYLISYNQDQSNLTMDILGQIIAHWKFNDNLPEENATCNISAIKCADNVDCPSGQSCSLANGTCELAEAKSCKVDDDCPSNYFCSSVKAKIIRDLSRVGKIEEMRESLAKYREKNGRYPLLSAGTYLPGVSTTLWPSWQESFLPSLSAQKNFLDPINRFGYCSGFDTKTCWNKDTQQFIYPKENLSLKLPDDSYALVYSTNDSGSEYNLCAVMESRDDTDSRLGYSLTPNDPQGSNCVTATGIIAGGNVFNTPPQITNLALGGVSGLEYNGFIRVNDRENDPLYWNISAGSFSGWSAAPIIKGTNDPSQKKLFADRAGSAGTYPVTITVTDSKGASTATTTSIVIKQANTLAEANEYIYRLDPVNPFNYSYYVSGSTSLPQHSFNLVSGPNVLAMANIQESSSSDGINRIKVSHSGIFSTSLSFNEDTESVYTLVTSSGTDESASNNFVIKVKVDRPILDFSCDSQVRIGYEYSCRLGSTKQSNHDIAYSSETSLPAGLEIVEVGEEGSPKEVFLQGIVNTEISGQEIRIRAVNEYDTVNIKSFILRVNNYCGDGIKQAPNSEEKGGMYNNGYEACDGASSVANTVAGSDKNNQYACNTKVNANTPYPIASNNYCVFKSPLDGGGYCGDTYCQTNIANVGGENKTNCPFDCDPDYLGPAPTLIGGVDEAECVSSVDCSDGFTCVTGLCQAKCWNKVETAKTISIEMGDATRAGVNYYTWDADGYGDGPHNFTNTQLSGCGETQADVKICNYTTLVKNNQTPYHCSVIQLDNPICQTLDINDCPVGCNSAISTVSTVYGGNDCKKASHWYSGWNDRTRATCYGNETILRCFGDACRTTLKSTALDGTINASGACVKNPPVCGDGSCNGTETCSTCASDCGVCTCYNDSGCGDGQECCGAEPTCSNYDTYSCYNEPTSESQCYSCGGSWYTNSSGTCCNAGACYNGECYSN